MLSLTSMDNQGSGIEYVSSRVQRLECWFVTYVVVEGDSGRYQSIPRTNANASHMNHAHSTLGRSPSTLSSSAGAAVSDAPAHLLAAPLACHRNVRCHDPLEVNGTAMSFHSNNVTGTRYPPPARGCRCGNVCR